MKRKHFIIGGIATASALAASLVYGISLHRRRDPVVTPDMLGRFCDEDSIRTIGQKYIVQFPSEGSKEKLKQLILPDYAARNLKSEDSSLITDLICERIQKDYNDEKMVILDGWILSQTEARQCAYFSLVNR